MRDIYKKQGYVLPINSYLQRAVSMKMSSQARSNEMLMPASCSPQPTVVALDMIPVEPGQYLYPSCTRLSRCSGCCSHPLLSCRPTETELVQRDLILVDTLNLTDRIVTANLTEHRECACQCKVDAVDCHPLQEYFPERCLCQCSNWTERELCGLENTGRLWDETTRSCRCASALQTECPTGTLFSPTSCRSHSLLSQSVMKYFRCEDIGESQWRLEE